MLLQDPNDLLFRKAAALHGLVLVMGPELQAGLSPRGQVIRSRLFLPRALFGWRWPRLCYKVDAGNGIEVNSTGTSTDATPRPTGPRAPKRRHVNSWLDNSLRRAVPDARREPPQLSATIGCFSSNVQRRRASVETTSNRETFEINVWSAIRLCLHHPFKRARWPSPERYRQPAVARGGGRSFNRREAARRGFAAVDA